MIHDGARDSLPQISDLRELISASNLTLIKTAFILFLQIAPVAAKQYFPFRVSNHQDFQPRNCRCHWPSYEY
jgi:hypothetical protein